MNKGLEALENIGKIEVSVSDERDYINLKLLQTKEYSIIEQELKDGEKNKQVVEIIKEKQVNMFSLLSSIEWFNPSHYNDSVGCPVGCELTQEEYDLLKEVLL